MNCLEEDEQQKEKTRHYGKYRGTVINNIDPMQIGRILVMVPDVSNVIPSGWAMPSLPGSRYSDGFLHGTDRRQRRLGGI